MVPERRRRVDQALARQLDQRAVHRHARGAELFHQRMLGGSDINTKKREFYEYWIVNPADKTVFIYVLKENQFIGMHPLIEEDSIQSKFIPRIGF